MNIAIASFASPFLDLFSNLAQYLEQQGHSVVFLNPDLYIKSCLQKQSLNCVRYPKASSTETPYNASSDLIQYFANLYHVKNIDKLIKSKNRLYSQAKQYIQVDRPDVVLFWNGQTSVERDICRKLDIPHFCCENGYFPGTLQMQKRGVNCNADIASLSTMDFMKYRYSQTALKTDDFKIQHIKQSFAKRLAYRFFDENYFILAKEAYLHGKKEKAAKKRFAAFAVENIDDAISKPFIFFPLQVNTDTQVILNSPYKSMYHALEESLPLLKATGLRIILKEHPQEVESVDYSKFVDNKQVFLFKKCDLNQLIDKSQLVVNINSSVGLQAVERHKKVLILGDALYNHAPSAFTLSTEMATILSQTIDIPQVDQYIAHFKNHIFITGNWNKLSVDLIKTISARLTENI